MKSDRDSVESGQHAEVAKFRCARCQHRLAETAVTCTHCGWAVDPALATAAARKFEFRRSRKHRRWSRRKTLYYVLAALAFLLTFVLLFRELTRLMGDLRP